MQRNPKLDWVVVIAVTVMCAILLPYIYFKEYPMDYVNGKLLVDPINLPVPVYDGLSFAVPAQRKAGDAHVRKQ